MSAVHCPPFFNHMKIILKRILAILAVVMVVALFGYKLATRNKTVVTEVPAKNKVTLLIASDYQVANATVPVIGQVDASASAFLKSELAARVDSVNVRIGDTVSAGDVLIELEHEILDAQVSQANAALDRSQSALNLRIAGATDEQVKQAEAAIGQVEASLNSVKTQRDIVELLSESSVKNAETALENANNSLQLSGKSQSSAVVSNSYENLVNTLQGSLTTVSNALRNSDNVLGIDNILGNDEFDQALLGTLDKAALDKAQKTYSDAKAAGQNIQELVLPLKKDSERSKIDSATIKVQEALQKVQSHLFDVDAVLQKTQPIFGLTQARLEGARASITASLAAVQAGIAALNAGQQAIKTASISLTTLQITQQKAEFDLEQVKKKVIEDKASADAAVVIQEKALLQAKAARDLLVAPPRAVDLAGLRASIREVEASYNVISRSR